jgi:plastocyanin domain-containing protein
MRNLLPVLIACAYALSSGPANGEQKVLMAHVDDDGVQRVRIVGGEYFFEPQQVVVKANLPVQLSLSKEASIVPHSFVINAPQAGVVVDEELSTDVRRITFTPTAPGIYPYYCRNKLLFFKSHRDKGMEGMLEVVP